MTMKLSKNILKAWWKHLRAPNVIHAYKNRFWGLLAGYGGRYDADYYVEIEHEEEDGKTVYYAELIPSQHRDPKGNTVMYKIYEWRK